jgi:hypothetical protein
MQFLHGFIVLSSSGLTRLSNLPLVSVICKCFAPDASAVMNGRLISVWLDELNSHLAFSAASRRRCTASLSSVRSIPWSFLNSSTICCNSVLSKSSPPKKVSPFVAFTSNTPPEISRMDTSNVPPPRSYTATSPSFLSLP